MSEDWLRDVFPEQPYEEIRFLSRAEVVGCLRDVDVVSVVAGALVAHHAGSTLLPSESYLSWENDSGAYSRSIGMPGALRPDRYGMKIINASVSNPGRGLERAGGLGLCFDAGTARITTAMEGGLLSAARTAAVSAISVEVAGFAGAGHLAFVGCGTQARLHLALFLTRWPTVREVVLHDRRAEVATALAQWCARRFPDVVVRTADTTPDAMAGADVVVFLTTASEGYVPGEWVGERSLLVHTSLGDLTDDVLLGGRALYVDDVGLITENPRRPLGRLIAEGRLAPGHVPGEPSVTATLGEALAGGKTGTRPDSGYVVANPFGLGVLDVALYHEVARLAEKADAGTRLSVW